MLHRLRLAMRVLRGQPGLAVLCVAVLGLGSGTAIATFAAFDALLLRSLPYPEPDRLVSLFELNPSGQRTAVSLLTVQRWESRLPSTTALGGYRLRSFLLENADRTVRFVGWNAMATAGLLPTIGVPLAHGRAFSAEEERAEAAVAVLGWSAANRLYGSAAGALTQRILLNEREYTVIGVLPHDFEMLAGERVPDLYTPISHATYASTYGARALRVVGRLGSDNTADQLAAELRSVAANLAADQPETHTDVSAGTISLHEATTGANMRPLLLMALAAGLLLATTIANATGLWLERSLGRRAELGIRRALGATNRQLAAGFATEGVLLGTAAAMLGLGLAVALLGTLSTLLTVLGGAPAALGLRAAVPALDARALSFAAIIAMIAVAALALAPLAVARQRDAAALFTRVRGRSVLVVVQVAMCVAIATGSGLLLRTLTHLLHVDPGYRTTHLVRFGIGIPAARFDTDEKIIDFHERLTRQLRSTPGIEFVGATVNLPLGTRVFRTGFATAGDTTPTSDRSRSAINVVSPGYFETMSIELFRGRVPTWRDDPGAERVVVVNQAFAARYLTADVALGTRLELGWRSDTNPAGAAWTVIGIVGDTRDADLAIAPEPTIYLPASQYPMDGGSYVLRSSRTAADLRPAIETALAATDPDLQDVAVTDMASRVAAHVAPERLSVLLALMVTAAVLAVTGLGAYGVIAMDVSRRRHEHGVRRALGASDRRIAWLVFRSSARLGLMGIVVGTPLALAAGGLVRSRLVGVGPVDVPTILGVAMLALLLTTLAGVVPALRTRCAEPAEILRSP